MEKRKEIVDGAKEKEVVALHDGNEAKLREGILCVLVSL